MTIKEKRWVLDLFCNTQYCDDECPLFGDVCKCGRGFTFLLEPNEEGHMTDDEIRDAFAMACPEIASAEGTSPTNAEPHIRDSGERRQFYDADGNPMAVRDIQEGKGRCDLMPLDVVSDLYLSHFGKDDQSHKVIGLLDMFKQTGDCLHLHGSLGEFLDESGLVSWSDMFLEVAIHFEDGAKKYGENNWQKGIPVRCYIDSAIRHYLKWLRGDKDEPHDRAFCWNILCAIWTCKHMPELNDYRKELENVDD